MNSKFQIIYPLLLAGALALGIYFGMGLRGDSPIRSARSSGSDADKFSQVVRYVQSQYVDSVDTHLHVELSLIHI